MKTIREIRQEGMEVLLKALGPDDTERFLSSLQEGFGDYTRDRHTWLPSEMDEIVSNVRNQQELRKDEKKE